MILTPNPPDVIMLSIPPVQILGTPSCRGGHSKQRAQFDGVTMSHPSPVDNLFAKTIVGLKFDDLDVKQALKPVMFYYPASIVTILPCPPYQDHIVKHL